MQRIIKNKKKQKTKKKKGRKKIQFTILRNTCNTAKHFEKLTIATDSVKDLINCKQKR